MLQNSLSLSFLHSVVWSPAIEAREPLTFIFYESALIMNQLLVQPLRQHTYSLAFVVEHLQEVDPIRSQERELTDLHWCTLGLHLLAPANNSVVYIVATRSQSYFLSGHLAIWSLDYRLSHSYYKA